ncbi:MAG: hypothetical protein ACR2QE_15665 [Acidimicrobiales bacterium]
MEHARNQVGVADAGHAEYGNHPGDDRQSAIITPLACALLGVDIEVDLTPGSRLHRLYGAPRATEHATCSYGLDPGRQAIAGRGGLQVAATDATNEVRAVERPEHRFFVATLYQPQLRSSAAAPHPIFTGFLDAVGR